MVRKRKTAMDEATEIIEKNLKALKKLSKF